MAFGVLAVLGFLGMGAGFLLRMNENRYADDVFFTSVILSLLVCFLGAVGVI